MVDVAKVEAEFAALGGLGRRDADDSDEDEEARAEVEGARAGVGAGSEQDEADEEPEEDDADSYESSEESDAAVQVSKARADRVARIDNAAIALLEARAAVVPAGLGEVNAQGRSRRQRPAVNYSADVLSQRYFTR
jgi:hypothetical protein